MDIQTLLGDSYKEGMTVEEINAALADKDFVDPKTLPKSVTKEVFDKTASELAQKKKELEQLKETTMTDDEKVKQALASANDREREFTLKSNRLDIEKLFVAGGLAEDDYKDVIEDIVTEDSEKSMNLAKNMLSLLNTQKQSVETALKAKLMKNTPKPPAGEGGQPLKRDYQKEIAAAYAIGDTAGVAALIRQQQEEINKGD